MASKVSLKLLIDTKAQRVLFAEAGKDFVDFLFSLLSLPMATVITLLSEPGMEGCMTNVYASVEALNENYVQAPKAAMDTLLKPMVSASVQAVPRLLPNIQGGGETNPTKFYACSRRVSHGCRCACFSTDSTAQCPNCRHQTNVEMTFVESPNNSTPSSAVQPVADGYVKGVVTYMVMDNLQIEPMSTISGISMLNKYNVRDVGSLEEKLVDLGMDQGVKLLKASLQSKNVLTQVFLGKNLK